MQRLLGSVSINVGCRAAAPLWNMDAIMAKQGMGLLVLVVTFALFLPEVAADIGKHPTMTLHLQKNGERAAGLAPQPIAITAIGAIDKHLNGSIEAR